MIPDYQWQNDTARFKELLDGGINVICNGIGNIIHHSCQNLDGTYCIYGTTYKTWEDVMRSDLPIYLQYLDTEYLPF